MLPSTEFTQEFANATLESRLRDYDIEVKFMRRDATAVQITEPLHEQSARRLIEAVENIAKQLVFAMSKQGHKQVECSPLSVMNSDVKIFIYATSEGPGI